MTKRQPDSKAVAEARVELAAIVEELKGIKARATAIERRLKRAAKSAKPLGELDGTPTTEEAWLAGGIGCTIEDSLKTVIAEFAEGARGAVSSRLAAAIAVEAKRRARREAKTAKVMTLLQEIKSCTVAAELPRLQAEFRQAAHAAIFLRQCWSSDEAWRDVLTKWGLTAEEMDHACGGRY